MRVLIIADVHANLAALRALPQADAVICAGDLVGLGPEPGAVIDELRRLGAHCVRGDEDDAIARDEPHPVPPTAAHAAAEIRRVTREMLTASQMRWLRGLPPELEVTFDGVRVGVTHAYPGDYTRYIKPDDEEILRIGRAFPHCEMVALGHTHRSGLWEGRCSILNPGSVGLPRHAGHASYAMLEDGKLSFREARYDPVATLTRVSRLNISEAAYREYMAELTRGSQRPRDRLPPVRHTTYRSMR